MPKKYSLGKEERLKSNLRIRELLGSGQVVSAYPLKIFWDINSSDQKFPASMAVSVPKKKFRRAVDRNLVKRRIREAYRQNKELIYLPLTERKMNISLVILFLSDEFLSFAELETLLQSLLKNIAKKLP